MSVHVRPSSVLSDAELEYVSADQFISVQFILRSVPSEFSFS